MPLNIVNRRDVSSRGCMGKFFCLKVVMHIKKWCAWINHVFIVNTAIFHKKQELLSSDFMVKVSELQTVVFIF